MATVNKKATGPKLRTHEGAVAVRVGTMAELRRSVMACLLWENTFYESGVEIGQRIADLVAAVCTTKEKAEGVLALALEARSKYKLRHAPLLLVREVARHWKWGTGLAEGLCAVIQRADELAEFVSLYWKDGKESLSAQVKKGLALAFNKFNAYDLAKYNHDNAVKLRDVLFLSHAKPQGEAQTALWKQLVDNTLPSPETWENRLSRGDDKKATWETMLAEKQLGALALLRNLRNMAEAGVNETAIRNALTTMKVDRVLPYRFIAAERYGPDYSRELETAMFRAVEGHEKLSGTTIILVDVSGSMDAVLSEKSDLNRTDAASALAILLAEVGTAVKVFTFSDAIVQIPSRRGFALRDAIRRSQPHSSTRLGEAINTLNAKVSADRLIVVTDEQSHDLVGQPVFAKSYLINVAPYKNGVGYGGKWVHIDGFSEAVLDYIREVERVENSQTTGE